MSDPRWAFAFAEAERVSRDDGEFLTRLRAFMAVIEAIAADGTSAEDREAAQNIVDDIAFQCRALLPAIIHVLAYLAKEAEDADIRVDARRILVRSDRVVAGGIGRAAIADLP